MKITSVTLAMLNVEMHHAIKTPIGEIAAARNVVVKIETDDGLCGWGEGSPMPAITGDSQDSCFAIGKPMGQLLLGKDVMAIEENMSVLRTFCPAATTMMAAFDMAMYDIAAKAADMPLYRFLGGKLRSLETDHTIGIQNTLEQTVSRTRELLHQGFSTIKLKTGRAQLEDVQHIAAVRDALGDEVQLRIDCNQGWSLPEALANLRQMEKFNIEYVEQPLPAWDTEGFARIRRLSPIPVCADESVFSHFDALKLIRAEAVDYLNIKLVKSGGLHTALKINSVAEAAGVQCMIGCFGESRLGLSAAAHLAIARPNIRFIDLDSAFHFKQDPVEGGIIYHPGAGGKLTISDSAGHGASFDESALEGSVVIR